MTTETIRAAFEAHIRNNHPHLVSPPNPVETTHKDWLFRAWQSAIEHERKQRGEPVAWQLRLPDGRVKLEKEYPAWADGGDGYSIKPLYATPQPTAPAQEPGFEVRERGFLYENGKHTPTLLLAFPIGDWDSRDRLAAMLAAAPKFGEEE